MPTRAPARDDARDRERVEALTRESLRWMSVAAIVTRVALTLPGIALHLGRPGAEAGATVVLAVAVLAVDALLVAGVLRFPSLLEARWVLVADLAVTVAATALATAGAAPGTFLQPGADAMTGYAWGTVGLWTLARGWRTGLVLIAAFVALQIGMARLNGAVIDGTGIVNLVERTDYALMIFVVTAVLGMLPRRNAQVVVVQGLRSGRLAARTETMREIHDTSLAQLDGLVLATDRTSRTPVERLEAVAGIAAAQLDGEPREGGCLLARIDALVTEFREHHGLTIDARALRSGPVPVGERTADALLGATREALHNVTKHADARRVEVSTTHRPGGVEVTVADDGRGFDPGTERGFGLRESIARRMADVGGSAVLDSAPGRGTRVHLRVPPDDGGPADPAPRGDQWFPLLPLSWRILALPLIAFVVAPFVPGHEVALALVCGGLLVGQLALLAVLLRPGVEPPLRSPALMALDLAAAAGLHLWLATIVPQGAITAPNSDNSWTYVMATAAFWLAARGVVAGAAVLAGAVLLDAAAIAVNGASGVVSVHHVVLLVVASGASALFIRWSRHGIELAAAGSRHAGRQAERLEVMARLVDRGRAAWVAIREAATSAGDAGERLHEVRGLALGAAAELRAAVRGDHPGALSSGLRDLADRTRRHGTRVELVTAELDGDPPAHVVDALLHASGVALGVPGRSVVVHACGAPDRVEVSVRGRGPGAPPDGGPIVALMTRAGGTAEVVAVPGGGHRIRLQWEQP